MIFIPAYGAIIGGWFGAWPMPLDWERPWQVISLFPRYTSKIVVLVLIGHGGGELILILLLFFKQEWPICVCYGAIGGYIVGQIVSLCAMFFLRKDEHLKVA